ncbi:WhiB family transcriptional regulator [Nocardia sp. NPDC051756]|uniref:WhiB family transcriptional regulator n=1 Tax=Nocardia sp. NPDC051756 TaxID=3154751 RepID=UPI003417BF04
MTGFNVNKVAFDSEVTAGWQGRGACRQHDPDMWFAPALAPDAKRICQGCPVWRLCGAEADDADERIGIRAGFDMSRRAERTRLRIALGRVSPKAEYLEFTCGDCGGVFITRRGYRICPTCRGLVDAGPVRDHILALNAADIPRTQIAAQVGMSKHSMWHLFTGKKGELPLHVSKEIADRICAIPVPARVAS